MTRTIEQLEEQVKEITVAFYKDLEEEYEIEFDYDEVQKAIRCHQDTIDYKEEKDLDEKELEELYRDWMDDAKDEVVSMKLEKGGKR